MFKLYTDLSFITIQYVIYNSFQCTNLKNPDVEYCVVVSDKRSGKSSLIGTDEGKELACKTPEIIKRTKGLIFILT